eukprot:7385658-Prymnesium_polylepis.2
MCRVCARSGGTMLSSAAGMARMLSAQNATWYALLAAAATPESECSNDQAVRRRRACEHTDSE